MRTNATEDTGVPRVQNYPGLCNFSSRYVVVTIVHIEVYTTPGFRTLSDRQTLDTGWVSVKMKHNKKTKETKA